MATAIQKLNDHYLTCIICFDLYNDPCTLSCGHTFCRDCLVKFLKTQNDAIKAKSLLCPKCKQMMKVPNPTTKIEDWVQQIKPSFLIQGLLDDFASRETVDAAAVTNPCCTCFQHGEMTQALSYCVDCDSNLCKKCLQTHNAIPTAANHDISDVRDKVNFRKKRRTICKAHNNIVEYCCRDCRKAVCHKCCMLEHRKCSTVVTIESMMPEMKILLKENRDVLSQQLGTTKSSSESITTKIKEIEEKKPHTFAHIKRASETAIDLIRQKEKQLTDELETITEKQVGDLRMQLKSEKIVIQMCQEHLEVINQTLTAESEMDMFDIYQICMSGAITTMSDTEVQLKYTSIMKEIAFVEEIDRNILLGSLKIIKEEFDIRIKSDTNPPNPVDVTVLSVDGVETVVVSDSHNSCLKSFYTRDMTSYHSSLALESAPWNVTSLNHNQVAVSYLDHNQITLVEVMPELVLLYNITTQKNYKSITVLNATTLVAGCGDSSSLEVLDLSGQIQRSITADEGLLQEPHFLSTTNEGNILVSDRGSMSVFCLTPEGIVKFYYSLSGERSFEEPRGIITFTTGDILVADWDNNKVIQLTSTGDFVRDILTSEDGIDSPSGICLHKGKMYIVQATPPRAHPRDQPLKVFRVN